MANTSYYLYQKYEQRGDQAPIPVYPNYWSVDGDGTMPKVKKMDNDPSCGYVPPVTAIYRWVNIDITKDYVCDECTQYRTISTGYTCVGYDKHYLDEYQVSYDAGATWQTLSSSTGSLIETNSEYCGYVPPVAEKISISSSTTSYTVNCDSSSTLTYQERTWDTEEFNGKSVSATVGSCVTAIGNSVLYFGTNSPTTLYVTIPDSVTSIGNDAIHLGDKDTMSAHLVVNIGSGITSIGDYAITAFAPNYEKGYSTIRLTITAPTPPTLGSNAITASALDSSVRIYVPSEAVNAYKSAWSRLANYIYPIS